MTYAAAAPTPTAVGGSSVPPVCQNCQTSTTPLWRRDESGAVLCNACGLFLKLHGRPRPISLKTDVIKSRNRVKTGGQGAKKRNSSDANGIAPSASHPATSALPSATPTHPGGYKADAQPSERSNSPLSRTGTPGLHHHSNIAPQHVFDGVSLNDHAFNSPLSSSNPYLRQPSPGGSPLNGNHLEPPMTYEGLRTRVSELEVINDLFRGRVAELEQSESDARRNEMMAREGETRLRADLDTSKSREAEFKRKLEELEAELAEYKETGPRQKRMRLSDIVDESQASTPTSSTSNNGGARLD